MMDRERRLDLSAFDSSQCRAYFTIWSRSDALSDRCVMLDGGFLMPQNGIDQMPCFPETPCCNNDECETAKE